VGGGARSELWCQIHADVLDRVVVQARDPALASARGAALQASVVLGHLDWHEVAEAAPIARAFEPDQGRRRVYDRLFPEFVNLYRSTHRIYARLNR
jgi:xylulokinase